MKNRFWEWVCSIVVAVLAFIPTYLFIIVDKLLSPAGFWEKLFVYGVGFYFLGAVQFVSLIVAFFLILVIWGYVN